MTFAFLLALNRACLLLKQPCNCWRTHHIWCYWSITIQHHEYAIPSWKWQVNMFVIKNREMGINMLMQISRVFCGCNSTKVSVWFTNLYRDMGRNAFFQFAKWVRFSELERGNNNIIFKTKFWVSCWELPLPSSRNIPCFFSPKSGTVSDLIK